MLMEILFSLNIVMIQLIGAFLRYLPFSSTMTTVELKNLQRGLIIWSAINWGVNAWAVLEFGLSVQLFKLTLFIGWVPYFAIFLATVRRPLKDHVFVLGMQVVWSLMLHSVVTLVDYFLTEMRAPLPLNILNLHGVLYLTLFVALLEWECKIFYDILPSRNIFAWQLGWSSTLVPVIIAASMMVLMADGNYPHAWREHISRIGVPLFFFLMYRSMSISTKLTEDRNRREHENERLKRRLEVLREYNLMMQEHQRQLEIFRHDRRHNYRLISAMLDAGDVQAAIKHVQLQIRLLDKQ